MQPWRVSKTSCEEAPGGGSWPLHAQKPTTMTMAISARLGIAQLDCCIETSRTLATVSLSSSASRASDRIVTAIAIHALNPPESRPAAPTWAQRRQTTIVDRRSNAARLQQCHDASWPVAASLAPAWTSIVDVDDKAFAFIVVNHCGRQHDDSIGSVPVSSQPSHSVVRCRRLAPCPSTNSGTASN